MSLKTAIKSAQPYIKEQSYEKVWQIFENEVTEESFIDHMIEHNKNGNYQFSEYHLKFIATFKNPQWERIIQNTYTGREALFDFVKKNADMTSKNNKGVMLGEFLLNLHHENYNGKLFKGMKFDWLYDDFIKSEESVIERAIQNKKVDNNYSYQNEVGFTLFNIIKENFTNPELINNRKYQGLFSTASMLTHSLTNRSKSVVNNPDFLPGNLRPEVRETLIDTTLLCGILINDQSDEKVHEKLKEKIANKNLHPDVSLMPTGHYQAWMNGSFNLNKPENIQYVLSLLDLGVIDKNNLNTQKSVVKEGYYGQEEKQVAPFLATFLDSNNNLFYNKSKSYNLTVNLVEHYTQILDLAEQFEAKGLVLAATQEKKNSIQNNFNKALLTIDREDEYMTRFGGRANAKIDNELMELSYRLHLPPPLLAELVDFFDKRYGFTPEKKAQAEVDNKVLLEGLKERWNTMLNRIEVVPEAPAQLNVEDKKKKVKP
jgi:hypothetical protein